MRSSTQSAAAAAAILSAVALLTSSCSEPIESPKPPPVKSLSEAERPAAAPLPEVELDDRLAAEIAALEALGYLQADEPAPKERGVTQHDPARVFAGYNLYTSGHAPKVFLVDMDGKPLHSWSVGLAELRDDPLLRRVHLEADGEILILMEKRGMVRLDRDSNILWHYKENCHHDFEVSEDGTIFVLTRKGGVYPAYNPTEPILNDFVSVIGPDGRLRKRVSLIGAFENSSCCNDYVWEGMSGDAFHSNTLELLDGRLAQRDPAFRKGNVLTSWRHLDAIGIIDLEAEAVVWGLRGPFRRQHQPTVLDNGRLLVFDNYDLSRGERASRVIELDPFSKEIHWEFHSSEDFRFYTRTGGSSARLPNGNVLITETRKGRVLEVARDGSVVWTFVNPAGAGADGSKIARIYEMQRLPPDFPLDWLE
jgi:hypothetical protein